MRKFVIIFLLAISYTVSALAVGNNTNFLPMEDAMSAARNAPAFIADNAKPYRQSFSLVSGENGVNKNYFDFTTTDILAFVLLAGIYIVFIKKDAKSRNASF